MEKMSLSEINLDNFSQYPLSYRCFLSILFALICLVINYWIVLKSDFDQHKKMVNRFRNLKNELAYKVRLSEVHDYEKQIKKLKPIYEKLLGKTDEVHHLLNAIYKASHKSGLTLELFSPQTGQMVNTVLIGEYQQFASFLTQLLRFNLQIRFEQFEITKIVSNDERTNPAKLRMDLKVKFINLNNK